MIVTDTFRAVGGVSFIYPDEALLEMKEMLREEVVRGGEGIGAFIRPQSVYFTVRDDNTTHQRIVTGYWCPDPREGVEFRGGPNDGKVLSVGAEHTRPPAYYRLPSEPSPPQLIPDEAAVLPTVSMQANAYRLLGIDSARDRWVYEYDR